MNSLIRPPALSSLLSLRLHLSLFLPPSSVHSFWLHFLSLHLSLSLSLSLSLFTTLSYLLHSHLIIIYHILSFLLLLLLSHWINQCENCDPFHFFFISHLKPTNQSYPTHFFYFIIMRRHKRSFFFFLWGSLLLFKRVFLSICFSFNHSPLDTKNTPQTWLVVIKSTLMNLR
jgi:hypothetical protein